MIFISGCKKHAKACITKGTKKTNMKANFWVGMDSGQRGVNALENKP